MDKFIVLLEENNTLTYVGTAPFDSFEKAIEFANAEAHAHYKKNPDMYPTGVVTADMRNTFDTYAVGAMDVACKNVAFKYSVGRAFIM